MSGIDIFTWFVLLLIVASTVVAFVVLGVLPGEPPGGAPAGASHRHQPGEAAARFE